MVTHSEIEQMDVREARRTARDLLIALVATADQRDAANERIGQLQDEIYSLLETKDAEDI